MEVRITWRSEVYVDGKDLEEIKEKWEEMPLFTVEVLDNFGDFVELVSAERVDDGSYEEVDLSN